METIEQKKERIQKSFINNISGHYSPYASNEEFEKGGVGSGRKKGSGKIVRGDDFKRRLSTAKNMGFEIKEDTESGIYLSRDNKIIKIKNDGSLENATSYYGLHKSQQNDLEKSDISYAFSGDGNKVLFQKTGAELKQKMAAKKAEYDVKYATIKAEQTGLKKTLAEAGVIFETTEYGDRAKNPNDGVKSEYQALGVQQKVNISDDIQNAIWRYNDLNYECREIDRDRKTMSILEANLNDKQKYQLTVNQLAVFEKSILDTEEYYFEKGERDEFEKGRSGKYTDNAQNRKLKRVGQEYGSKKKEDEKGNDKEGKEKEPEKKESSPEELAKLARTLDEETLKRTASKSSVEAHRKAAHAELLRRQKEESSDPSESKTMDDHVNEMQQKQGSEEMGGEDQELQERAEQFDLDPEDLKDIEETVGATLESVEDYDSVGSGGKTYVFDDGSEWNVYDSEDDARDAAKESLQKLIDDIGVDAFSPDFVQNGNYIDLGNDARHIAQDLAGDIDEFMDEARDELSEDDYEDESEYEQAVEERADELQSERVDEYEQSLKDDPKGFLVDEQGLYLEEDFYKKYEDYIDTDKLIEDAIDTDGIAHTLSSYDGNEVEAGGKLMYRHN